MKKISCARVVKNTPCSILILKNIMAVKKPWISNGQPLSRSSNHYTIKISPPPKKNLSRCTPFFHYLYMVSTAQRAEQCCKSVDAPIILPVSDIAIKAWNKEIQYPAIYNVQYTYYFLRLWLSGYWMRKTLSSRSCSWCHTLNTATITCILPVTF